MDAKTTAFADTEVHVPKEGDAQTSDGGHGVLVVTPSAETAVATAADASSKTAKGTKQKSDSHHENNVRKTRIEKMMSKAELARRANLSVLTIDRIEKGYGCRMDTKRKILEALGLSLADRVRVFGEEE